MSPSGVSEADGVWVIPMSLRFLSPELIGMIQRPLLQIAWGRYREQAGFKTVHKGNL